MIPLAALRAIATARRARVTAKLARLRRVGGVTDSAAIDPRRALKAEGRLNRRSVEKYIRDMDSFLDRNAQFVADSKGRPIPAKEFKAYKKLEEKANLRRINFLKDVENIPLPGGYSKVGDFIRMFGPSDWKPNMLTDNLTMPTARESKSFTSLNAMRKVIKALENENQSQYGNVKAHRRESNEMFYAIGNDRLTNKLKLLDDRRLATLWSGSGFLNSLISLYEMVSQYGSDYDDYDKDVFDVEYLLDWAMTI